MDAVSREKEAKFPALWALVLWLDANLSQVPELIPKFIELVVSTKTGPFAPLICQAEPPTLPSCLRLKF